MMSVAVQNDGIEQQIPDEPVSGADWTIGTGWRLDVFQQ
jgi:hypothetical protein